MRHVTKIAPIIAFHSALQSNSAVYSCFPDSSKVRPQPLRELGQKVAGDWF